MRFKAFFVILLCAAAGFYGWGKLRPSQTKTPTIAVMRQDIVEAVYATGEVEPRVWVQVRPRMTVRFDEVLVEEGARVAKGDLLARADTAAEEAILRELQSRQARLAADFERDRKLQKSGYLSKKAFDASTSDYRETQARIDNQKQLIARMSLTAPEDGIVLRRDVEPGEVKEIKDDVFWVGKPDDLRITTEVDEEDILKVKVGQKVLIKADALPGKIIEGRVDEVTPKGDPVNKSFRVRIGLPADSALLIGMTAEVNIITAEKQGALLLPLDVVQGGFVTLPSGEKRAVETGVSDGQKIEITGGLAEGDTVIAP